MSEASPFRPALIIGVIVAGLVSFAAFLLLLGWGGAEPGRTSGRATATSIAATGFKGLFELSEATFGARLVRQRADLYTPDLLVVPLEEVADPEAVRDLLAERPGLPTVLILPKWAVQPDPDRRGWVRTFGPTGGGGASALMGEGFHVGLLPARPRRAPQTYDQLDGLQLETPRSPQVIRGDDAVPIAAVGREGALVAQLGNEPHYVIADPDLVNNHGLRSRDKARAAIAMLDRMRPEEGGIVRFDLTLSGLGSERNLLRSMFEPPFLAMTLALLAAALLAFLHGAARFGPARPPVRAIPFGKAALVENSAALVRLAGREVRLGGGYADLIREETARGVAAPPHLRDEELDAHLDRFTRPGAEPFSQLAFNLRSARDRSDLVAAAQALFRWKKDMTRWK